MTTTATILKTQLAKERETLVGRIEYIDAVLGTDAGANPAKNRRSSSRRRTFPMARVAAATNLLGYC